MFVKFKPLTKISFKNKRLLIKHLLSFCFFRIYPKSVAFFINLIPCFSTRYIFLRSNCDHFGSWTHVFMAYAYLKSIRGNINLFVFARKDTINKSWLNYINQLPIKIIYNN